jgi:hypothetical protein
MLLLTGHLQLRINWSIWASSVLITPDLTPVGPPPVPWTEKETIEKFAIFRPTRRSFAAAVTWLDGQLSDFIFFFGGGFAKVIAAG